MDFWLKLFDTADFSPRWHCGLWTSGHGWLHILSDIGVWSAYFAIPCILAYFVVRRKDLPFRGVFLLFVSFILACGTTHLMDAAIFWWPAYRLAGVIKLLTAIVSWATVIALIPAIPRVLAMRSPEALEREVAAREKAELEMQRINAELEERVQQRTAELREANEVLRKEREWFSTTLSSIGDGVITTDIHGCVTTMNRVAESLVGWTQQEASGQPLTSVFNIVHEKTRQVAQNPALEALEKKQIVGLAPQTILIAKDGAEHPIDDSAAPICNVDGKVSGSVLVFRDVTDRRRSELSLRTSEERLRLAIAAGRLGTWEWHIPTGAVIWSPELEAAHGLLPGSFAGTFEAFQEDIHPDDRHQVLEAVRKVVEEGSDYRLEYRIVLPDGSVHWLEARGELLRDELSEPVRLIGVCSDVTDRKLMEVRLQEQFSKLEVAEARMRSVVENVVEGIITVDESGQVTSVNPAAEHIFGYSADEILGMDVRLLMPDPDIAEGDGFIPNYVKTGQQRAVGTGREVSGKRKDGSVFPAELAVSEFHLEHRKYFTGLVRDITDRKRVDQSLRFLADASKQLFTLIDYRSTLQQIARLAVPGFADWCAVDMINAADELDRLAVAHIDPAKVRLAEELHRRYPPRPEAPHGPLHVIRTGAPVLISRIDPALLKESAQDESHYRLMQELKLTSYICVPFRSHENCIGAITFVTAESGRKYDLDDLAMAEELARRAAIAVENARLYQEVRDADRRKDEFLAMLGHELRNPLAPIRSGLDLLALDGGDHHELIQMMQGQMEHVVRLVDDLLDVSRIMRGKVELRKEPVELTTIISRSLDALRSVIDDKQLDLVVSLSPEPIWLNVDPVRLSQVVENLLNNAVKYTDAGGRIELRTEMQSGLAGIIVADTGMGIEPELLPKVFDLFTQSSRSLDRAQGGLGIGLTLVKRLVELHGGAVAVCSDGPGRGSEFSVRLPIGESITRPGGEVAAGVTMAEFKILVVDDHASAAEVLAMLLKRLCGHNVDTVFDGPSALKKIIETHPRLVLLDIGLPGMDGYQVARQVRQHPELNDVLLIALTGYGLPEDRRKSKDAGFDEHLVKPPSIEQLKQLLAHPKLASAS